MTPSTLLKLIAAASAVALIMLLGGYPKQSLNAAQATAPPVTKVVPSPTPIYGGAWTDGFWDADQLSTTSSIVLSRSGLALNIAEYLNWIQTWTAHFALGGFFQTQAISDSVQLAPIDGSGQFFTTGTYTSTVFDAGRTVDWFSADWNFKKVGASSIQLAGRTGNTLPPDDSWTDWIPFVAELSAIWGQNPTTSFCSSDLQGIESSRYLQYRATFNNGDSSSTPILYDINIGYRIYAITGTATSEAIAPIDLRSWKQVYYTATVPISTALTVDILAPDGTVLLPSVSSGDSLAGIDPSSHRSIQLRASFATNEPAYTPELDAWSVTW